MGARQVTARADGHSRTTRTRVLNHTGCHHRHVRRRAWHQQRGKLHANRAAARQQTGPSSLRPSTMHPSCIASHKPGAATATQPWLAQPCRRAPPSPSTVPTAAPTRGPRLGAPTLGAPTTTARPRGSRPLLRRCTAFAAAPLLLARLLDSSAGGIGSRAANPRSWRPEAGLD